MNKFTMVCVLAGALIGTFYGIGKMNASDDNARIEEVLKIEENIKTYKIYPEKETIDRLYRYRNNKDSKYSFEGPSKKFCEVYDRVIKPL